MGISVDIQGAETIASGFGKVLTETERKANVAIQRAGINTMTKAKSRVQVKTGYTRDHITYEAGDLESTVTSSGPAVPWLETGTRKMRAYPYFYPSYNEAAHELEDELKEIIP